MPYALDYANESLRSLNAEEFGAFETMQAQYRAIGENCEQYRQWWESLGARKAITFLATA